MTDATSILNEIARLTDMTSSIAPNGLPTIGDWEVQHAIQQSPDGFHFETVDRGSRSLEGTFSDAEGAVRMMIAAAASEWRSRNGLSSIAPGAASPKVRLTATSESTRLDFAGGWAEFSPGFTGSGDAALFSYIATAPLKRIWKSFQHPAGKPLF